MADDYEKLMFKKQYTILYDPHLVDAPPTEIDNEILRKKKIFLYSYQRFVRNHINPDSPGSRLLLKMGTGSGKTKGSLAPAIEFIKFFKQHNIQSQIFIIGFQKEVFIDELLSSADYGFITEAELEKHNELKKNTGQFYVNELKLLEMRLKKRLTNMKYGGYFRFMGYRELFNALFFIPDNIWREYGTSETDEEGREMDYLNEEILFENIKSGVIKVNRELVEACRNTLMIFDEFHHTCNSIKMNSYGVAIKFLLDMYDVPKKMTSFVNFSVEGKVSALFLTATIANNNAREIIDMMNLVIPSYKPRLNKADFFDSKTGFLKPHSLKLLSEGVRDYVSFLINLNPKSFPQKKFIGEPIAIPKKLLNMRNAFHKTNTIPYLKFIRAEMTGLHLREYRKNFDKTGNLNIGTILLNDIVMPLPAGYDFNAKNLMSIYQSADAKFMSAHKLHIAKNADIGNYLSGAFFEQENLRKYSSKYCQMLKHLKNCTGKVFIAHPYVTFGVFIIQEVLNNNGYIEYGSSPTKNTLCAICNIPQGKHTKTGTSTEHSHPYTPACYINMYGGLNKKKISMFKKKYNALSNINGEQIKIIIGSRIVFEGIDFNSIQHIFVMSFPTNISVLLQIIGRGVRDGSHKFLPPDKHVVNIYIMTSKLPGSELSYEEYRYFIKMEDYITIQIMEKTINANAIDAIVNYNYIKKVDDPLTMLPFQPTDKFGKWLKVINGRVKLSSLTLDTTTYDAFYTNNEIDMIVFIIKRLLLERSKVFHIDDLWEHVKNPPFTVNVNTTLFDFDNFLLAVDMLTNNTNVKPTTSATIFDTNKLIFTSDKKYIINYINDYIMLLPFKEMMDNSAIINTNILTNSYINSMIDYNTWARDSVFSKHMKIDINDKIKSYKISYEELKHKFYIEFNNQNLLKVNYFDELYNLNFHKHLIRDTILYIFYILVNPEMSISEMHEFYFKLLYLYYKLNLIIFASDLQNLDELKYYKKFIVEKYDVEFYNGTFDKEVAEINPMLLTYMSSETDSFNINRINKFVGKRSISYMSQTTGLHFVNINNQIPKLRKITKVPFNILPVGHYLTQTENIGKTYFPPEIYIEERKTWMEIAKQRFATREVENDIIIGYFEQDKNSINLLFKLREPTKVQQKDKRLMSKGMNCFSKDKKYLREILGKLGVKIDKNTITNLCDALRAELIKREIASIKKAKKTNGPKVRWFYFHYETVHQLR